MRGLMQMELANETTLTNMPPYTGYIWKCKEYLQIRFLVCIINCQCTDVVAQNFCSFISKEILMGKSAVPVKEVKLKMFIPRKLWQSWAFFISTGFCELRVRVGWNF